MFWVFFGISLAVAALAWLACLGFYKLQSPQDHPARKPLVAWFPKYRREVTAAASAKGSEAIAALASTLESEGFSRAQLRSSEVVLERGVWIADSLYKPASTKLRVTVAAGSSEKAIAITVEYGAFAIFDTGGLWAFCGAICASVERGEN
ncbi:MAG: hypothetical protein AAF184_11815 [Pseudomonadota bacterium]